MSVPPNVDTASRRRLLKATLIAVLVAAVLLVAIVLPAEYGIDPTGIGGRLGLTALAAAEEPATASAAAEPADARNAEQAQKAVAVFGASDKQSFAAEALSVASTTTSPKHESLSVTLSPGKGAEVKTLLKSGDGIVFRWSADAAVAVDMHGERTGVKGAWTSYSVEAAQREGAGTFVAPFDGSHGWYWENRSASPVTVQIDVVGFQSALYQP
jgi:hypothetical protein